MSQFVTNQNTGFGHQFKTKERKYRSLANDIQELIFKHLHGNGFNPVAVDDKDVIALLSGAQELCESIAEHEREIYENND